MIQIYQNEVPNTLILIRCIGNIVLKNKTKYYQAIKSSYFSRFM